MNATDMSYALLAVAHRLDTVKVTPFMITVSALLERPNVNLIVIGTRARDKVVVLFDLKPNDGPGVPIAERVLSVGDWQGVNISVNHIDEKAWMEAMAAP